MIKQCTFTRGGGQFTTLSGETFTLTSHEALRLSAALIKIMSGRKVRFQGRAT